MLVGGWAMARHYYRTNVPLPVMTLKWVGLGILGLCFLAYNACVNGPKRGLRRKWDREHFNG
jgi:hypothetical protein